jgi:uroporphyrinogen decarboxylase
VNLPTVAARDDNRAPHLSEKVGMDKGRAAASRFLRVLNGEALSRPPLWLMRQAGRYLPEYRELRATAPNFLSFCYDPAKAAEVTLQPIRRFGFDAAIIFSDILVVPDALGQPVSFEAGEGPRLAAIEEPAHLSRIRDTLDMGKLAAVYEAIDRVKSALAPETALIGFCGAPWTVATYMIAGRGTPDQAPARLFAYRHPDTFQRLIDILVEASIAHLSAQIKAGVDAVQIFDSWAGVLPDPQFARWTLEPIARIAEAIRAAHPAVKIIAFPRGVSPDQTARLASVAAIDCVGLDTSADLAACNARVARAKALQGNLDPLLLLAGGPALEPEVARIRAALAGRPHIFNLGHGILPPTPIAHVERLIAELDRTGA